MHPHAAIESAIGTLANTMRLYVESQLRFNELFAIDREEAIDNVDRALEAKLEAFHTLYDVSKSVFPYFDHADTSLLIAMRNAIHHRNHPLFRSLKHRLFLEHRPSKWRGASFLLAAHGTPNGAPPMMSHHFQLADFRARLDPSVSSPYLDITVTADKAQRRADLVEKQLSLAAIDTQATKERYPKDQVYLDLVPIFISAAVRVFKALKSLGIAFKGFDAETYVTPFTSEIEVDLSRVTFGVMRIGWWADE
jgi:hypothetical protein